MVAKNSPAWLPAGWSVQHKEQKNGEQSEYYTNSETGQKFYSKNDVLRYLNMGSILCNPPQPLDSQPSSPPQSIGSQLSKRSRKEHIQVVKSNEFPEWLPEGWIMELKTKKSGSAIGKEYKCYVDPSTGRKFYSKPEVLRYLKSAKLDSSLSEQKKLGSGVHSIEDNVVEANELPEWLPEGWTVELERRKFGERLGNEYKIYVDPSTGLKFYSKPEVFRHLNSVNHNSCPSKQEELSVGKHSTENVVVKANESPEWLPKGWIVELKTHQSGSKIGKKFKYYVDPSTGRKFLSKPQVFQHLESVKSGSCSFKQKDLGADVHSTEIFQTDHSAESGDTPKQNVSEHVKDMKQNISSCKQKQTHVGLPARNGSVEKVAPDGLPPGWVLEIKIKGKRRDPYYTDPVSGYVFRSRKDVFRYLETGEVGRHACKRKNMSINDSETITNGIDPPSAAKMQELSDRATRRQLFAGIGKTEVSSSVLPNAEGTILSRVTRSSSKTKLSNAEGTSISRVTRASSKTRLVTAPTTESIKEKHPLEHTTAGKGSSEVSILTLPSPEGTGIRRVTRASSILTLPSPEGTGIRRVTRASRILTLPSPEGTGIRRVTRASAKASLVAAPATESLQEKLPLKEITAGKGSSEVSNLALANTEPTSMRRFTRGSAKKVLVSAPTNESFQEKHPLEHIASGKGSSEMSSVALPIVEGTVIKRVTRGSTKTKLVSAPTHNAINKCTETSEISDPSGSASSDAKGLKRKRGQRVDARTKHVSTPAADILKEKELMESTTEKCAEAKENPYPAKGSKKKQGKKGYAENGSVPVPIRDMLEEGKLLKTGGEEHINRRTRKNSSNIKNQKELNLTRRSSKRLAGLGSELVNDLQAPQVAAARDNSEDILALNLVVDSVAQWASQPLEATPKFAHKASVSPGNAFDEELSYKSNMLPEDQTSPKEHVGNLEAEKKDKGNEEFAHKASVGPGDPLDMKPSNKSNLLPEDQTDSKEHVEYSEAEKKDEGNPEPQPSFAFDSWPDPCLEFAFKTLTGALPIEDNPDIQGYFQQQTDSSHIQKDGGLSVPELGLPNTFETNSSSHAPDILVSGALQIEDNPDIQGYFQQQTDTSHIQRDGGLGVPELGLPNTFETNGSSHAPVIPVSRGLQIEDNPHIQGYFQQQTDTSHIQRDSGLGVPELGLSSTFETNGSSHAPVIPVSGGLQIEDNPHIQGYFQQQTDTSHIQRDSGLGVPELGLSSTFETNGSSHCDAPVIPVSGALSIEDNQEIQGYFQQQSGTNIQRDGGLGVPELGLPNSLQIDGSCHCDAPVIPVSGQQLPVNPSFMPSSNVSLPGWDEIDPQQPRLGGEQ